MGNKITIDELEALFKSEEEFPLEISPDGTVRWPTDIEFAYRHFGLEPPIPKPLTMKENLGGEYAARH